MKNLVELAGVSKHYLLGKQKVPALHDISLSITRGELISIIGPSGSGKSTLLHLIGDMVGLLDALGVEQAVIAGVMEHIEEAGIHSGDSSCVLPAQSLTLANALEVEHIVKRLAPALGVVGLVNIQLAIADSTVYVLEANPRASRSGVSSS